MKKLISIALSTGLLMGTVAFSALAYDGNGAPSEEQFLKQKHTHVVQQRHDSQDSREFRNQPGAKPEKKKPAQSDSREFRNRPGDHFDLKKPSPLRAKINKHSHHFEEDDRQPGPEPEQERY